jgi:hypothetical protein
MIYLGTNCLTAFIVTPIIGNHLNLIGVKFAYCAGMLFGERMPFLWFIKAFLSAILKTVSCKHSSKEVC